MAQTLKYSQEQYQNRFDPKIYLKRYTTIKGSDKEDGYLTKLTYYLNHSHAFWTTKFQCTSKVVRCLEFGGGPDVSNLISAAPKVDHIVFSDFVEASREAVLSWVAGDREAHNWKPFLEYTVQVLEGEKDAEAVQKREQELKQKLKSVVACDVSKTPVVDLEKRDDGKPFDVVITKLCLESCVQTEEEYKAAVNNLGSFVGPRGYLLMSGVLQQIFYCVGDERFFAFSLTEDMVKEAMQQAGFKDVDIDVTKKEIIGPGSGSKAARFFCYGQKAE